MITITAKYRSTCFGCKDAVNIGDEVLYDSGMKKVFHSDCVPQELVDEPDGMNPKAGTFSTATDGYRKEPLSAEELAEKLGFKK